jgi:hypothetical protein
MRLDAAIAQIQARGGERLQRLSQEVRDNLIPEGSDETVEPQLEENVNTWEMLAPEIDYVLALFMAIIDDL